MKLFNIFLDKAISEAESNEISIKFIGDLDVLEKNNRKNFFIN